MTRGERDFETIRRCVRQAVYAIVPKIVVLALFTIADDGRTRGFESSNRLGDCTLEQRFKRRVIDAALALGDGLDEAGRSRDAANGFGGNRGRRTTHARLPLCVQPWLAAEVAK